MTPFKAGAIALVVIAIGCWLGFTKKIPFQPSFQIKAAFKSSNNIRPHSPVRIAGVQVGEVTKVEPTSKGADSATITMKIQDAGRPIHADATAKIRPRIFLEGNFFVDLTAGSPQKPVLDNGDTIPITQTATPVQFGEVLKALNSPTRQAAQSTLKELATADKDGFPKAFNKSLPDQAPAYKYSAMVLEALLGREPHDLSNIVRDLGTTSAAIDRSPPRLQALITYFNQTAAAFAVQKQNLEASVHELPRTLAVANPTLDALNAAFPPTREFAVKALPGVRSSLPTVIALRPFVHQLHGLVGENELRGLMRDLRRATPGLVKFTKRSVPTLNQMRALASCANQVLLPWSKDTVPDKAFPEHGPVYQSAVKWLPGLAGESRSFDANGQYVRTLAKDANFAYATGDGRFFLTDLPIQGVNPPKAPPPPYQPTTPCETQQPPDLRTKVQAPPEAIRIDQDAPGAAVRRAAAEKAALAWMRDQLKATGLDRDLTLSDQLLRPDEIDDVVRTLRGGG